MKKIFNIILCSLSVYAVQAQDVNDALRYSNDNIQGSARYRALSGAFGALGGDMSAVGLNPAGSVIFAKSKVEFTLSNAIVDNKTQYFNGLSNANKSKFDLNQAGGVFVFQSKNNSPWNKIAVGINYDKTNNFNNNWRANGTNTSNKSIDLYFLDYAKGKRLDQISALNGENFSDAYEDIGEVYDYGNQQALLGYESYILEPKNNANDNTEYSSNIGDGTFDHDYNYTSTGFNGKVAFNFSAQYNEKLSLGINLNSHFISFEKSTLLYENNNNAGSTIKNVNFNNYLAVEGTGFSFQLGAIYKISPEFRVGLIFDSPTWYSILEETSQYLSTVRTESGSNLTKVLNPQIVNVYPEYRLQTPSKLTASLAYVFGTDGLISFDYSRKDYSSIKFKPESDSYFSEENGVISNTLTAASTYKIGGEYRLDKLSIRGGFRLEESPYANGTTASDLSGFSAGLGYNFGNTTLDLSYDQAKQTFETPLYNIGLNSAAVIDRKFSNITLTLGFNL